eukprot:TRINITY_DN2424_c0_g1_i1.p1 TRINITY_DN2424_c0_g1~~TRINITY_DN2424_c0_g1_i1.p1  ORF type:complete len:816 (+),score=240.98 TRINITY_DN2424_c0_g1_i1:183-2630(+)
MAKPQLSDAEKARKERKKHEQLRRLFIAKISREGIWFVPLLFMVVAFVYLKASPSQSSMSQGLEKLIFTRYGTNVDQPPLREVYNADTIYGWIQDVALPRILSNDTWGGTFENGENIFYVNELNILLGGIRFIQKRVPSSSCTTKDLLLGKSSGWTCYRPLSEGEDKSTWTALENVYSNNGVSWGEYQDCDALGGCAFVTYNEKIRSPLTELWYNPTGYTIQVGLNYTEASEIVTRMKENTWIDKHTRLVIMQFATYNGYHGLTTEVEVLFELLAAGEVIADAAITTVTLLPEINTTYSVLFVLEIGIYALALGTLSLHVFNISRLGFVGWLKLNGVVEEEAVEGAAPMNWRASQVPFEIVDYVNVILLLTSFGRRIEWWSNEKASSLVPESGVGKFINIMPFVQWVDISNSMWGVNVLIMVMKCFKYLQASDRLNALWRTLVSASVRLGIFLVLFFLLMAGFTLTGMVLFGDGDPEWFNFSNAFATLAQTLMKQPCLPGESVSECQSISEKYPKTGIFFSVLFTLMIYLITLAMFLVLISNSYSVIMDQDMAAFLQAREVAGLRGDGDDDETLDKVLAKWCIRLSRQLRLLRSQCALCDFTPVGKNSIPEGLDALSDDELDDLDDDEGELNAEEAAKLEASLLTEKERELNEMKARHLARDEALQAQLIDQDKMRNWNEVSEGLKGQSEGEARRSYFSPEDLASPAEETAEEQHERLLAALQPVPELEQQRAVKEKLEEELRFLDEEMGQYSDLQSQLPPESLAKRYKTLSQNAREAGLLLTAQRAANTYSGLCQLHNRSAVTSKKLKTLTMDC